MAFALLMCQVMAIVGCMQSLISCQHTVFLLMRRLCENKLFRIFRIIQS